MHGRGYSISLYVLALLLAGCSAGPARAPVDSRDNSGAPPGSSIPRTGRQAATASAGGRAGRGAPAGGADVYLVRRGDTLYSIAWQHGLNYRELAAANGIRHPYTIYTGQRLRLKPPAAVQRSAARPQGPARPRPLQRSAALPSAQPVAGRAPGAAPQPVATVASAAAALAYDGRWTWPTRGRLLRGFHADGRGKKGIDIGGHAGQPVKAAANGKVVYAGSGLVGYGRLIIIKHNENLLSAYGHNSKLLVAEGDHVKAGQQIAEMGSSGTNRTELYFEIRKDGRPVDPLRYLPRS